MPETAKEKKMRQQTKDAVNVIVAMAEAIRSAKTIKSGTLYALSMNVFQNVDAYESCINVLVDMKLVMRGPHHDLVWIGEDAIRQKASR